MSYFLISEDTPWPGYLALIPTLGAYLVLVSNFQNNFLLQNFFTNHIGKWSYSIYVWHWPLVVIGFYFAIENWWTYGIPLSILLGFLSYHLIEKINLQCYSSWKDIYKIKPFYIFLLLLTLGFTVKETNGIQNRFSPEINNILNEKNNTFKNRCLNVYDNNNFKTCTFGNTNNIKAIVLGDSHADAVFTAVTKNLNLNKHGIVYASKSSCPYIENAKFSSDRSFCNDYNISRHKYLKNISNTAIILVNRYPLVLEGENNFDRNKSPYLYFRNLNEYKHFKYVEFEKNLTKSICSLTTKNPVYLVLTIPEYTKNIPDLIAKNQMKSQTNIDTSLNLKEYLNRSKRVNNILIRVANNCNAKILDPTKFLCNSEKCFSEYNGRPLYRDSDHLSEYGNKFLTPMSQEVFKQ